MDKIDLKILSKLTRNARISITQLAKDVRLSKTAVKHRIENLEKKNIIQKYIAITDEPIIYGRFILSVKASQEQIDQTIQKISSLHHITWVASISGIGDLAFVGEFRDQFELKKASEEIKHLCSSILLEQDFSIVTSISYCTPTAYGLEKEKPTTIYFENKEISSQEQQVLSIIKEHSRASIVDIATKSHIATKTATKYLRLLEKKCIRKYSITINTSVFGYDTAHIFWKVNNKSSEAQLEQLLLQHPNTLYITKALGRSIIESEIIVESQKELYEIIQFYKENTSEIIDFEVMYVVKIHKQ